MQIRKVVPFLQRKVFPFLAAAVVLVSPLSLCASAASWSGTGSLGYCWWGANNGVQYMAQQSVTFPYTGALPGKQEVTMNGTRLDLRGGTTFTSPVSIYISGYLRQSKRGPIEEVGDPYNVNMYQVSYKNAVNQTNVITPEYISIFGPEDEMSNTSDGMTLMVRIDGSEASPVSDIFIRPIQECGFVQHRQTGVGDSVASVLPEWFWTSVRIIGAENSETLGALDDVASEIVAGNEILEAMKGDVVALLQDIYSVCGDINIAADRTNDLLDTLLGYVDGLEGQLGNIYSTLSSFTAQLISLLQANNQALLEQIQSSTDELHEILTEICNAIYEASGGIADDARNEVEQGIAVQEGLNELERPDYEDIELNVGDYVDQFDDGSGESAAAVSGFMGVIFQNSMVTSMLMISLTFAMAAYVLYGKR